VCFETASASVDESVRPGESATDYVQRLSRDKAVALAMGHPQHLVIGADTVVVLDGQIFGKPADTAEARHMLGRLSGRWHDVLTGVTLRREKPCWEQSWVSLTRVGFHDLSPANIEAYIDAVNPLDKAGAYGIQDHGEMLVCAVDGLMSNVIGLPVEPVLEALASFFLTRDASADV